MARKGLICLDMALPDYNLSLFLYAEEGLTRELEEKAKPSINYLYQVSSRRGTNALGRER